LLGLAFLIAHGHEDSMSDDATRPVEAALAEGWNSPTLLESLPRTDPAVLREMEATRVGQIHYAAIGRVAAAWSRFEFDIDGWNMAFAGLSDEVSACFTAQVFGSRGRADCFIALVRHFGGSEKWFKKWLRRLEDFSKEVQALGEQRNRAIHDVWQLDDPSEPHRLEVTARRALKIVRVHVPTRELLDLEAKILNLDARFHGMAAELHRALF